MKIEGNPQVLPDNFFNLGESFEIRTETMLRVSNEIFIDSDGFFAKLYS